MCSRIKGMTLLTRITFVNSLDGDQRIVILSLSLSSEHPSEFLQMKMCEFGEAASIQLSEVESINILNASRGDFNESTPEDAVAGRIVRREYIRPVNLKLAVVGVLTLTAVAVSIATYSKTAKDENNQFLSDYEGYATKLVDEIQGVSSLRIWAGQVLSADITSEFAKTQDWPFVTLNNFSRRTVGLSYIAKTSSILYAPLVTNETRSRWETYAVENQQFILDMDIPQAWKTGGQAEHNNTAWDDQASTSVAGCDARSTSTFIEDRIVNCSSESVEGPGPFFPIWQMSPLSIGYIMTDLSSIDSIRDQVRIMVEKREPKLSRTTGSSTSGDRAESCTLLTPVFGDVSPDAPVVGVVGTSFDWRTFFSSMLPHNVVGLQLVLTNTCGQVFTFEFDGPIVAYIDSSDSHDTKYDALVFETQFDPLCFLPSNVSFAGTIPPFSFASESVPFCRLRDDLINNTNSEVECRYSIHVYPSDKMKDSYTTSNPAIFAAVIVLIFVFSCMLFLAYDCLVERRQRNILKNAARSDAIVHSLFPVGFRDRVFQDGEGNDEISAQRPWLIRVGRAYSEHTIKSGTVGENPPAMQSISSSLQESREDDMPGRRVLLPILPETPKIRLKSYLIDAPSMLTSCDFNSEPIAEMFTDTTIMFADIAGFTAWSSEREPSQVFILLETLYRAFDAVAHRLGVFKVETIGDCYVAVAGLPDPNDFHAVVMTYFAYECIRQMKELVRELEASLGPGTSDLCMRVGLHSGPVTAGVLRGEKSRFQLFGDSVNTAARMESTGEPNLIHASQNTADLLVAAGKFSWVTARDDVVSVKGKGAMNTFWLKPRRESSRGNGSNPYLMDNSSCASSTIDSRPKHRVLVPHKSFVQKLPLNPLNNDAASAGSTSSPLPNAHVDSNKWGNLSIDEALSEKASISNQKKAAQKKSRLIDWNVDLLLSFLAKVVANRDEPAVIQRHRDSLDDAQFDNEKSTRILSEVTEVILLPDFDKRKHTRTQVDVLLPPEVRDQLHDYVSRVASMYRDIPFHNLEHASHVTMSAVKLMRRIINPDDIDGEPNDEQTEEKKEKDAKIKRADKNFYFNLHKSTFGISSDPLTQFCVVFSALIHVSVHCLLEISFNGVAYLIIVCFYESAGC